MVQVTVRTPLHATESPQRVQQAATAFWPDAEVTQEEDQVVATATDLDAFRSRVWQQHIIDTVRSALLAGCDGQSVRFRLSKQAALGGRVSLPADRHALGDLDVTVRVDPDDPWDDGEGLCWWLCPETEEGKIVGGGGGDPTSPHPERDPTQNQ